MQLDMTYQIEDMMMWCIDYTTYGVIYLIRTLLGHGGVYVETRPFVFWPNQNKINIWFQNHEINNIIHKS